MSVCCFPSLQVHSHKFMRLLNRVAHLLISVISFSIVHFCKFFFNYFITCVLNLLNSNTYLNKLKLQTHKQTRIQI